MSKLKKILSIICLAAAFMLLAACGDPASSLFPAKTVKFQPTVLQSDGKSFSASADRKSSTDIGFLM